MSGTFIVNLTPDPEGGFHLEFVGLGTTLWVDVERNAEVIARSYLANRMRTPIKKIKLDLRKPT